eukprot:318362_1
MLAFPTSLYNRVKKYVSSDTTDAKKTPYKRWTVASAIALSTIGTVYAASRVYRATKHDNIPTLAVHDYHYLHGHLPKILDLKGGIHEWLYKECKAVGFPPLVSVSLPTGQNMVFVNDPKTIKFLYEDKFEITTKKADDLCEVYWELLGKGIFAVNGKEWRFHRKIASRIFSLRNLKDYMFDMSVKHTKSTIAKLKSILTHETKVDINDILGRFTLDTFCEIAFGSSIDSVQSYPDNDPFGIAFDDLVERTDDRTFDILWKIKRMLNVGSEYHVRQDHNQICKFIYDVLDQKMKQGLFDVDGEHRYDLLKLYQQYDSNLSREKLKDIALNFIIAGRDTTRMCLSWLIYELCRPENAEVKNKLIKEMSQREEPTFKQFQTQFGYLEGALCESLRLHPPVPLNMKGCILDTKLPIKDECGKNYVIRKGDRVFISHYTMGRCPKIWGDDPLTFEPNRWKAKGMNTYNQYEFGVFNVAPRMCLGKTFAMTEAKVFMYYFLKNFEFERVKDSPVIVKNGAILNMDTGLHIHLAPI